jgi:hypothetical protein
MKIIFLSLSILGIIVLSAVYEVGAIGWSSLSINVEGLIFLSKA